MVLKTDYFVNTDGGRQESRRPKQKNDCTVIAVAISLDINYDLAYDALQELGRKSGEGFFLPSGDYKKKNGYILGKKFEWIPCPSVKGQPRENGWSFLKEHKEGRYILRLAGHVRACVDGCIYDGSYPDLYKCVYGYWKIS
jgi:hypothetical protein